MVVIAPGRLSTVKGWELGLVHLNSCSFLWVIFSISSGNIKNLYGSLTSCFLCWNHSHTVLANLFVYILTLHLKHQLEALDFISWLHNFSFFLLNMYYELKCGIFVQLYSFGLIQLIFYQIHMFLCDRISLYTFREHIFSQK